MRSEINQVEEESTLNLSLAVKVFVVERMRRDVGGASQLCDCRGQILLVWVIYVVGPPRPSNHGRKGKRVTYKCFRPF